MTAPASGSVINASWDQVRAAAIAASIDDARAAVLFERLLVPAPAPLATQRSPLASQSTLTRTVQTLIFAGTLLLMGAVSWLARSSYEHNGWVVSLPIVGVLLVALLVGAEISLRKGADALAGGDAGSDARPSAGCSPV